MKSLHGGCDQEQLFGGCQQRVLDVSVDWAQKPYSGSGSTPKRSSSKKPAPKPKPKPIKASSKSGGKKKKSSKKVAKKASKKASKKVSKKKASKKGGLAKRKSKTMSKKTSKKASKKLSSKKGGSKKRKASKKSSKKLSRKSSKKMSKKGGLKKRKTSKKSSKKLSKKKLSKKSKKSSKNGGSFFGDVWDGIKDVANVVAPIAKIAMPIISAIAGSDSALKEKKEVTRERFILQEAMKVNKDFERELNKMISSYLHAHRGRLIRQHNVNVRDKGHSKHLAMLVGLKKAEITDQLKIDLANAASKVYDGWIRGGPILNAV